MLSRVVDSGLLPDVPTSMIEDLSVSVDKTTRFISELLVKYMPTTVIVERFMAQGIRVGTTIEIANVFAGIILYRSWEMNLSLIHI